MGEIYHQEKGWRLTTRMGEIVHQEEGWRLTARRVEGGCAMCACISMLKQVLTGKYL